MALWHFMNGDDPVSWTEGDAEVSSYDDGDAYIPGEDFFSSAKADKFASKLGKGIRAEYTGTPNWAERIAAEQQAAAEAEAAEQQRVAAEAEIDAMLAPPVDPLAEQRSAVNTKFDQLLIAAPDRKADIEKLRGEALAEIVGE